MNIYTFFDEMFSGAFLLRNGEPLVVVIFNGAFIYGCFDIFWLQFFSSIMPDFRIVLYFPSTIRESQWLLNLPRHFLDVQILIFIGFFDLEVKLIILSICLWFFSSWNLKFVLDYQYIFVSYCNCGFNDSNWSNNILVILKRF